MFVDGWQRLKDVEKFSDNGDRVRDRNERGEKLASSVRRDIGRKR